MSKSVLLRRPGPARATAARDVWNALGPTNRAQPFIISAVSLFHHIPLRVMWSDTDPAGIVWFGVFFRYFENAEEELFRVLGRDRTPLLHELGIFMPRTSLQSRFRSPARLGDEIEIGVGVDGITDRRIEYAFDVREQGSQRLICEASYRVACVDAGTFTPRAFPEIIVRLLSAASIHRQPAADAPALDSRPRGATPAARQSRK